MSKDLGYTNAQWLRGLQGSVLYYLRQCRSLLELERRFTRTRTQLRPVNDAASATPHITALTLSGISYGVNTTARGEVIVRFVANASNWDVEIYMATGGGGGDLIAQATNVAASATGAVVAQNSSGVNGSVTLGATITGDVTDKHRYVVDVDWGLEAAMRWPNDGDSLAVDDPHSAAAAARANAANAATARSMVVRTLQALDETLISAAGNDRAWGNEFLQADETTRLTKAITQSSTGVVTRLRTGILPILFSAMEGETTGSTQDVVERVVDAGTVAFDASNDGQGTVADHTPGEHCPIGTWYFTCIAGHDDGPDVAGRERFSVRFAAADSDETFPGEDFRDLTVGQEYNGPLGFGPITLARTLSKANDGSNTAAGAASTFTLTGETGRNTASGILYGLVVDAGGSTFNYEFYSSEAGRSAGNTHGDLKARVAAVAAATATQATERNGSGLSVDFTTGSSPSNGDTFEIDAQMFKKGDNFSIATTLTSAGLIQEIASLVLGWSFPSDTSGSEQIDDDEMRVNVPHHGYMTVDV